MNDQLSLFQRKTFPAAPVQGSGVVPSKAEGSVLSTLPAYLAYLQSQGYSPYTPADFCGDVKKFGLFVGIKPLKEISVHDLREWLSVLRTKEHLAEKTVSRKLTALSNFFTWLISEGVLEVNLVAGIPNHKVISPLPEILFEEEVKKLLGVASRDPRSYFLVLLLLETGMKIEE